MNPSFISIDDMHHESATQVKNKWGEVVKRVVKTGSVAVTNHSNVEMVILEASIYQALLVQVQTLKQQDRSALDALTQRFDASLHSLQDASALNNLNNLMQSKGQSNNRPKAGKSH